MLIRKHLERIRILKIGSNGRKTAKELVCNALFIPYRAQNAGKIRVRKHRIFRPDDVTFGPIARAQKEH